MKNLAVLLDALRYIEAHLRQPFTQAQVAAACHLSLSALQKLFRYALQHSLGEYITKRRLTEAAKELLAGEPNILQLSMDYQYQSPEGFARAFRQLWGVNPSQFRQTWQFTGIFPKINQYYKGVDSMYRVQYDITDLHQELCKRVSAYVLYFDIKNLSGINQISQAAGDTAIRECLRRIEAAAGAGELLFRIGGDEFALVTETQSPDAARDLAIAALQENGKPIHVDGLDIPIAMWAGAAVFAENSASQQQLFAQLQSNIDQLKTNGEDIVIL